MKTWTWYPKKGDEWCHDVLIGTGDSLDDVILAVDAKVRMGKAPESARAVVRSAPTYVSEADGFLYIQISNLNG